MKFVLQKYDRCDQGIPNTVYHSIFDNASLKLRRSVVLSIRKSFQSRAFDMVVDSTSIRRSAYKRPAARRRPPARAPAATGTLVGAAAPEATADEAEAETDATRELAEAARLLASL